MRQHKFDAQTSFPEANRKQKLFLVYNPNRIVCLVNLEKRTLVFSSTKVISCSFIFTFF